MSRLERLNQWLVLLANLGVVGGLVFLTLEVRANTATNRIAIYQSSSQNWMALNTQVAQDADLAALLEKANSDVELSPVEVRRFEGWVKQHLTHAAQMRRLYDSGLLTPLEIRGELREIRELARGARFRHVVPSIVPDERFRGLILDEDGFERWLSR